MRIETLTFEEAYEKHGDLLRDLYYEVDYPRYGKPYAPDTREYSALDGELGPFVLVAYSESRAVGLIGVSTGVSPRSKVSFAYNDFLYVVPEYRNTPVGGLLAKHAERKAAARGFDLFRWDVPPDSVMAAALRKRSEYVPESVTFVKDLTGCVDE